MPAVKSRRRLVRWGGTFIGLALLMAPLRLWLPELSSWGWIVFSIASGVCIFLLRKQTNNLDTAPSENLDEYQLIQVADSRQTGYRFSIFFLMLLFAWGAVLAVLTRISVELTPLDIVLSMVYGTLATLLAIPFIVLRSLSGRLNRDELISARMD